MILFHLVFKLKGVCVCVCDDANRILSVPKLSRCGTVDRLTLMNISGGMLCESRPAAAEYEEMKDRGSQQRQVRCCGPPKQLGLMWVRWP